MILVQDNSWEGGRRGSAFKPGGGARKIVPQKILSENHLKIRRKMVTKRVAMRAVNKPMVRIDTEFRDESNGDIPGVPWVQIWVKNGR